MNEILKDAYDQYSALGFIMHKAATNKKHAYRKGPYAERVTEPFEEDATGYVAIIPPNIIIIDNDSYEEGNEFEKLLNDLDLDYTPEPFAVTPSGGTHYAFENPYPEKVVGNHGYAKVDIYGGYQSVIPIVGTTAVNKRDELGTYNWADDIMEELTVNAFSPNFLEVLKMTERGGVGDNDYDEMGLSLAIKAEEMPDDEVERLCELIPIETYGYDTGWLKFAMALYDRTEGSAEGLELFQKTCERYDDNDPELNAKKWNAGNFKPNGRITFKTLRSLANEGATSSLSEQIATIKSVKELDELFKSVKKQRLNTTSKTDEVVREELIALACEKSKELSGKPDKVRWKKALKFSAPPKEAENHDGLDVFRLDNRYVVRHNNKVIQDVGATMLKDTLSSLGVKYSPEELSSFKSTIQTISGYREIPDYTLHGDTVFNVEGQDGTRMPIFTVRNNPINSIPDIEVIDECVDEFFHEVWNGKLHDIVRLIALTVKTGEQKLNRLMVIAPSNSGKSEIFTLMRFQKITMARLLNGMRGDKGVGSDVIKGIRASGLLLIDEANKALEAEIKDMDKELHIDQFGQGGTQIMPLAFTALTSTHSNATRNNSDELYNRFLQVELSKKEMAHTVTSGPMFLKYGVDYTNSIQGELFRIFKETLTNDEGKDELRELQAKYRLPLNTDLDELLYEIGEEFMAETKRLAKDHGDVVHKQGEFYYKRKSDVIQFFENKLGEIDALDVGKYGELLTKHFVTDERKSMKIDGKPVKYYHLNMVGYTDDEDLLVINQFDDLDLEGL